MQKTYDAVIVGAGISGLTAGALLAKKAKKVLILESYAEIGGYLSGFTRKAYYFDAGLTRSNISYLTPYFRELGVQDCLHFAKIDAAYYVNGRYVPYDDVKGFFYSLSEVFSDQRDNILALYDKEVAGYEKKMKTLMYSDFKSMGRVQRYLTIARIFAMLPGMMRESSSKVVENDILKRYLNEGSDAYAFLCTRPDQINYRGHMSMSNYVGRILSQLYNYYPTEGYLHLCKLIQSVITEHGGELVTGARVTKIRVENNVATGVDYRFRGQIQTIIAANVISAIDLNKASNELLGRDVVPSDDMRKLESSTLGLSVPVLFLGAKIAPERLRQLFNGKEELHYYPCVKRADADLNDVDFFSDRQMAIHASSLVNPAHASPGCSNIQLYLSCPPIGWQSDWGLMNGQRTEQYRKLKEKVIADVLASLEKLIPELKNRSIIDVCELGTPHTNERYTGNTNGVALGFNFDGYRMSAARINSYYSRLSNVSHLFFIGHQTGYGGGLNVAFGSAKRVADEIGRQR